MRHVIVPRDSRRARGGSTAGPMSEAGRAHRVLGHVALQPSGPQQVDRRQPDLPDDVDGGEVSDAPASKTGGLTSTDLLMPGISRTPAFTWSYWRALKAASFSFHQR